MHLPIIVLDPADPNLKIVTGDEPGWSAVFDLDERRRFVLKRPLPDAHIDRVLVSCGQNPSEANAFRNDNTVRKEIGFGRRWELGRYIKVNVYSWRATDPDDLWAAGMEGHDIVGERNDEAILSALVQVREHGGVALAAWGNDIEDSRERRMRELADMAGVQWMALGKNKSGSPRHSLYPPYTTPLVRWP